MTKDHPVTSGQRQLQPFPGVHSGSEPGSPPSLHPKRAREPPRPGRARSEAAHHGSFPLPGCSSLSVFRNPNTESRAARPAPPPARPVTHSLPPARPRSPGPPPCAARSAARRGRTPRAPLRTLPGRRRKRCGCHGRTTSAPAPLRGGVGGQDGGSSPGGSAGSESPLPLSAGRPLPTHRRCRLHIRRAGRGAGGRWPQAPGAARTGRAGPA